MVAVVALRNVADIYAVKGASSEPIDVEIIEDEYAR